jgi:transcriptional regulator GlxA family with amidase domain
VALRLAQARSLLRQSSLTVAQVGTECGFPDASHFARVYRQKFGSPPSADRATLR